MTLDEHYRNTRDLADTALQVLVAGGNDEDSVLFGIVYDAVISMGAWMLASYSFKSRVFR